MKIRMIFVLPILLLLMTGPPAALAQEAGLGMVSGVVYDATTGQPIAQIAVEVAGQPDKKAVTTIEGTFKFDLPPGTYSLKLTGAKHMAAEVTDVTVTANEVFDASTVMAPADQVTSIDVVEKISAVAATAESMIAERKLAQTVSDGISGLEIRRSAASDAAGALAQVTGVTVVEDSFVYVRGLGERYSSTQLNNAMLATTEPERRVVPLDLFPAALIDNIQVLKTYTPDLPGEFSAGLVQIKTAEFPAKPTMEVSYKIGFNDRTQFKEYLKYPGGGRDFWGLDDGTRAFPSSFPSDKRIDRFTFTPQQLQEFGRQLSTNWQPVTGDSARPSQDFGVVAGGSWGKFGLVGAFQFSNQLRSIFDQQRNYYTPTADGGVLVKNYYDYDASNESIRMGGILNASYQLTPANKFYVRNFLSRDTDNETRFYEGFYQDYNTLMRNSRLRWVERSIYSMQAGAEHLFSGLGNSVLNWQLGYSKAKRDEPDLRENVYQLDEIAGEYRFYDDSQSAFRMYNNQDENIWNPTVNWMTPFYRGGLSGSLKLGFDYSHRERDFLSRRLRLILRGSTGLDLYDPPNTLFAKENIRPDGFELGETTRVTDAYLGERGVYGGFGMVDLNLSSKLRVVAGLRIESVDQNVTTFDPFKPDQSRQESPYAKTDILPGVNVMYYLTARQNVRFGFSQTVSRPDFRELALFDFVDLVGGRQTVGNPDLKQTSIQNFDARWEWFPGGNQLIAASFFYKRFTDPIEQTVLATVGLLTTYANADTANNFGFELEFRRNLAFLTPRLREFSASANFTFVDSTIDLTGTGDTVLTSKVRAMQGQSRYVTNVIGEWARPKWRSTLRGYLNYFSSRISDVGSYGLPDVVQSGVPAFDVVYEFDIQEGGKWKLRFSAENLNDPAWLWTQAGQVFQSWTLGRSYKVGTSYRIF